jgi:hypothetical protein
MVYDKFESLKFEALADNVPLPDPKVIIEFNGSGIHKIAGPTPLISLTSSYNRSPVGQLDSIEKNIKLIGKIVRSNNRNFTESVTPSGSGVSGLVQAYEALENMFSECSAGTLEILCDGESFFKKDNVKVNSLDLSSEDNFVQVADYTVDLSFTEPGAHGFLVKNTTDEWSIEPLEDYIYINYSTSVDRKPEFHNPDASSEVPISRQSPYTETQLDVIDVPRYKISRKLSAVGLPPTGTSGCTDAGVNSAYLEAKDWVESKLITAFNNTANTNNILNSGLPALTITPDYVGTQNTYLYNHVRSVNYSISEGSYSVSESWLAMPTAIRYLEDYDIDISTDENYVKSVTVKGEVQGLYLKDFDVMAGSGGSGLPPEHDNIINIDYDQLQEHDFGNQTTSFSKSNKSLLSKNKYENALSGFLYDVKPYIYTRASMGLNNGYYTEYFLDTSTRSPIFGGGGSNAPQIRNPTYVKEAQLNIIPIGTSETHNAKKGTLSYTYQFNNKPNFITGVISSNITVDTTFPNDVFAEAFVLGRSLGPVLQDLGTITTAKKNINIEVNVIPPDSMDGFLMNNANCPLFTGGHVFATITGIIESLKPYGDQQGGLFNNPRSNVRGKVFVVNNQENWNPTQGKYTLSLGYVYQPCNASISFRNT